MRHSHLSEFVIPEAGFPCELASSWKTELCGIQMLDWLDASFRWHDKKKILGIP